MLVENGNYYLTKAGEIIKVEIDKSNGAVYTIEVHPSGVLDKHKEFEGYLKKDSYEINWIVKKLHQNIPVILQYLVGGESIEAVFGEHTSLVTSNDPISVLFDNKIQKVEPKKMFARMYSIKRLDTGNTYVYTSVASSEKEKKEIENHSINNDSHVITWLSDWVEVKE